MKFHLGVSVKPLVSTGISDLVYFKLGLLRDFKESNLNFIRKSLGIQISSIDITKFAVECGTVKQKEIGAYI
jgi:hypothetical protein